MRWHGEKIFSALYLHFYNHFRIHSQCVAMVCGTLYVHGWMADGSSEWVSESRLQRREKGKNEDENFFLSLSKWASHLDEIIFISLNAIRWHLVHKYITFSLFIVFFVSFFKHTFLVWLYIYEWIQEIYMCEYVSIYNMLCVSRVITLLNMMSFHCS